MAVRNCADLGDNLKKIMNRLLANQDLIKLLYYTDADPLSNPDLTQGQIKEIAFNKLIRVIPRVEPKENSQSIIAIRILNGTTNYENSEFKNVIISIESFVPLSQWMIAGDNLRPFAILGQIQESLNNKTINGLGKMTGGDFQLEFVTNEVSCYEQTFTIISYD